ncbi:hypothetical protein BC940DRAFT_303882 [Gongronella butleri]|nr:hypothetical protein BC940DRAFT_303882 [Gongronella butleri]
MTSHSIDAWVLMALVYKDLDDMDYANALLLSERLYAIDETNSDYRCVYGKCLYALQDYNGAYDVLKDTDSVPCLHLFARACLALGDLSDAAETKHKFFRQGIHAVQHALKLHTSQPSYPWGNDLASVSVRHHRPSEATLMHLLGELYIKLDNIRAAAAHLFSSLRANPFKLAAYIKVCEIAPDVINVADAVVPEDIFREFTLSTTSLKPNIATHNALPPLPSANAPAGIRFPPSAQKSPSSPASAAATTTTTAAAPKSGVSKASSGDPVLFTPSSTTATASSMTSDNIPAALQPYMPALRSDTVDVSLSLLQALVRVSIDADTHEFEPSLERGDIEREKDDHIAHIQRDIEQHRTAEAFKNKHGLHRKPPADTIPELSVELQESSMEPNLLNGDTISPTSHRAKSATASTPPRVVLPESTPPKTFHRQGSDENESPSSIKQRLRHNKRAGSISYNSSPKKRRLTGSAGVPLAASAEKQDTAAQNVAKALIAYFVPTIHYDAPSSTISAATGSASPPLSDAPAPTTTRTTTPPPVSVSPGNRSPLTTTHNVDASIGASMLPKAPSYPASKDDQPEQLILDAMNRVIRVIRILALAFTHQSSYHCRTTALALQQLDDRQYDTPRVLSLMGHAYYDTGDYQIARVFYRRSFSIAPWFCDDIPLYSTCLWYLHKEQELNLLAYKMKSNQSRRYEAYIAAGNWTKCVKRGNEAIKWFQKAVELRPSNCYGHALLGYEEWEKGNHMGAKQHFAKSMLVNKRFYLAWYGAALAYVGMHEFPIAHSMMQEALRLHPHHPVLLCTMADISFKRGEHSLALDYANQSIQAQDNPSAHEIKKTIEKAIASSSQ